MDPRYAADGFRRPYSGGCDATRPEPNAAAGARRETITARKSMARLRQLGQSSHPTESGLATTQDIPRPLHVSLCSSPNLDFSPVIMPDKSQNDNRSRQLNPQDAAYHLARGVLRAAATAAAGVQTRENQAKK